MNLIFEKHSGCGNDFILVDNRDEILPHPVSRSFITKMCHRQKGIGADGLILLEKSLTADFCMRIFNCDGSEAEMCGNGIRCLANYIISHELTFNDFSIQTMHQILTVKVENAKLFIHMPFSNTIKLSILLKLHSKSLIVHFVDTGVPHVVIFVDDLTHFSNEEAKEIRFHPIFGEKGTNVNYAKILKPDTVYIRTYERGVEAETLACGTGAAAVALITKRLYHEKTSLIQQPIYILTRSEETLSFAFDFELNKIIMSGPAEKVYTGSIAL